MYSAQYQQNPLPAEGGMIDWGWFRTYDVVPERSGDDMIVQSWDTASKADEVHDYSVCTTWLRRGKDSYLLDVVRARLQYPQLKAMVVALAKKHDANEILIEDAGSGIQLIQDLYQSSDLSITKIKPEHDKVTRLYTQAGQIEAGHVHLPRKAPWLAALRDELLAFPNGAHDDQADSLSQYLRWHDQHQPGCSVVAFYEPTFADRFRYELDGGYGWDDPEFHRRDLD